MRACARAENPFCLRRQESIRPARRIDAASACALARANRSGHAPADILRAWHAFPAFAPWSALVRLRNAQRGWRRGGGSAGAAPVAAQAAA